MSTPVSACKSEDVGRASMQYADCDVIIIKYKNNSITDARICTFLTVLPPAISQTTGWKDVSNKMIYTRHYTDF